MFSSFFQRFFTYHSMGNAGWRTFETDGGWSDTYRSKLLEDIKGARNEKACGSSLPRILLWGPVSAGKSSFFNSIASIDEGHFVSVTNAGCSVQVKSLTKKLNVLHLSNKITNFRMMDVMGLENGNFEGLHVEDTSFLMEGNIKENYKFDERNPIAKDNKNFFQANPSLAEKAHCNVLMISAHVVDTRSLTDELMFKLLKVKDHADEKNVPTILVLTKVDEVCEAVAGNIKKVYTNKQIELVVKKASEMFGIPEMNIFPVKNYSNEVELKTEIDILLLLAVRQIVRYACHTLSRMLQNQQNPPVPNKTN